MKVHCLISITVFLIPCYATPLKPGNRVRWEERAESETTSPTISVQRFGGSTFYNYLKFTTPTEATSTAGFHANGEEESATETTSVPAFPTSIPDYSSSQSSSDDDDSDSFEEVVLGASEDVAKVIQTTTNLATSVVLGEDARTEAATSADAHGADGSSGGAEAVPPPAEAPVGDSNDGGNTNVDGDGSLPSDQTAPPAEAVPGQPEDDPSSSSSSSSESSSSSSSEEFRQNVYRKKYRDYNPVKSKDSWLMERLQSKLTKKENNRARYFY